MAEESPERGKSSDDARIDALHDRIAEARKREDVRTGRRANEVDENYRLGNRVLADLIAGIGGGALVGWVLDRFLDTAPWLLLTFLFLGIVVAFRNIFRLASRPPDKK